MILVGGIYIVIINTIIQHFIYSSKSTNLNKIKDEIIIVMNMKRRNLKFTIDNEDKGESYSDIYFDKPIFLSILLYDKDDSFKIIKCQIFLSIKISIDNQMIKIMRKNYNFQKKFKIKDKQISNKKNIKLNL